MDPNNMGIDPHLAYLMPFFGLFALVSIFIYIIPFWMIFKKAGFTPWLCAPALHPAGEHHPPLHARVLAVEGRSAAAAHRRLSSRVPTCISARRLPARCAAAR